MVGPADMRGDARLTCGEYIGLVAEGRIQPSDRIELLEGLVQDRITKTRIYAGAAIGELWIINVRDACIEVYRDPDPSARLYRSITRHPRGDTITPAHFPTAAVAVDDLLPQSR